MGKNRQRQRTPNSPVSRIHKDLEKQKIAQEVKNLMETKARQPERSRVLRDKAGNAVEVGHVVDVQLIGMFQGIVAEVHEPSALEVPGQPPKPPYCTLVVTLPVYAKYLDGRMESGYVVGKLPDEQIPNKPGPSDLIV